MKRFSIVLRTRSKLKKKLGRKHRRFFQLLKPPRLRIPFTVPTIVPYVLPYIPVVGRPLSIGYNYVSRFWRLGLAICAVGFWDHVMYSLNPNRPRPWLDPIGAYVSNAIASFLGPCFMPLFYNKKRYILPPLPKGIPEGMMPKTLVLVVKEAAAHKTFNMGAGMNLKKRPYLEEFVRKMGQIYELIIYSDEDAFSTDQLIQSLDPMHQLIAGKIGSDGWIKFGNMHYFNWKGLNRDIRSVIVIDSKASFWAANPRNLIYVDAYDGGDDDSTLMELIPFLEHLGRHKDDVRDEIDKWGHYRGINYWVTHVIEQSKMKGNSLSLDSNGFKLESTDQELITTGRSHPIFGVFEDFKKQ